VREQVRRDPSTCVRDAYPDDLAVAFKPDFDTSTLRCELDPVRDKVGDDLMEPQRIAFPKAAGM
jgi:hypothetical protein